MTQTVRVRLTGARLLAAALLGVSLVALLGPVVWGATHDPTPGATAPAITSRTDPRANRLPGEDEATYVARVSRLVHNATAHCADNGEHEPQTWEVSVARLLGVDSITHTELVTAAGFRCGYCSQRALLLSRILRHNGIGSANAYGLNGHVVTSVDIDGRRFISDPDIGVPLVDPMNHWAVMVAYADHPIPEATVLSHNDDQGTYPRTYYDQLAALQRADLELIGAARWALVLIGPCLVAAWRVRPTRHPS